MSVNEDMVGISKQIIEIKGKTANAKAAAVLIKDLCDSLEEYDYVLDDLDNACTRLKENFVGEKILVVNEDGEIIKETRG